MELHHTTINGHDIAFRREGRGPLLVLIHGMVGSSATWRHVIPALARRFTVVAPDLLGHGASVKPRTDYSLGAYASSIRDLMAALGHDRGTLVGHSFGGGAVVNRKRRAASSPAPGRQPGAGWTIERRARHLDHLRASPSVRLPFVSAT